MDRQASLYQLPFLASALVSLVMTVFMARRATHRGSGPIVYIGLSLVLWSTMNALEIGNSAPTDKVLWANVSYIGIVAVPVLWVLFALVYTGHSRAPSARLIAPLAAIPIITLVLLWTGPRHGLIGQYLHRGSEAVAGLLPLVLNAVYLLGLRARVAIDLTPVSFTVSGVVVAFGVYRYGLLDIVPVARAAVVEGMRDGLVVMDAENRVLDINEAAAEILGQLRRDILGAPIADVLKASDELLQTRGDRQEDIELAGAQDTRQTYELRVSALYGGRGRLTGRLAVLRDVTLQRRADQEREVLLREVERRVEQLSALATELTQAEERERRRLAQLLHDHLQQLLVGAKMHAIALGEQMARRGPETVLQQIIVLLDQSIATSRALTVELSPPILYEGTLAEALAWLARWVQERHGLTVVTRLEPQAEPAGDDVRILLFQAARELLFNVVKHAHVERAFLGMRLVDERLIELVVADEGVGFGAPAEAAMMAAEGGSPALGGGQRKASPAVSVRLETSAPTGFGLFSIRERLQLLGGRMEIASAPRQGTRVTLYAPATPSASGEDISVLLVDDHRAVREGLAALLREEPGIRVVGEATNGPMALELAARLRPDVVVMDVTLPGMSGIEVTRRIHSQWPTVRVVGLSAHAEPDIALAMREAGAETYLDKREPAEALISAIRGRAAPSPKRQVAFDDGFALYCSLYPGLCRANLRKGLRPSLLAALRCTRYGLAPHASRPSDASWVRRHNASGSAANVNAWDGRAP